MRFQRAIGLALVTALLATLTVGPPASARSKKPPLAEVTSTAWIYTGSYVTKARRTGLREHYTLEFVVDFFDDNTFTLQCLPIEPGMEDEFFSGFWEQRRNRVTLVFDQFSQQMLRDQFEADLAADLGGPVEVFIERWEVISKLKRDRRASVIFIKFKERLKHLAIFEGIPIRVKTRGRGRAEFFENIGPGVIN